MTLKSVVGALEPAGQNDRLFPQPTVGMVVPLKWSPTVWSTWLQFPPPAAPSQAGCTTPPVVIFVWPSASLGGPVAGSSLMPPPVRQQVPSRTSTQASAPAPPRGAAAKI